MLAVPEGIDRRTTTCAFFLIFGFLDYLRFSHACSRLMGPPPAALPVRSHLGLWLLGRGPRLWVRALAKAASRLHWPERLFIFSRICLPALPPLPSFPFCCFQGSQQQSDICAAIRRLRLADGFDKNTRLSNNLIVVLPSGIFDSQADAPRRAGSHDQSARCAALACVRQADSFE